MLKKWMNSWVIDGRFRMSRCTLKIYNVAWLIGIKKHEKDTKLIQKLMQKLWNFNKYLNEKLRGNYFKILKNHELMSWRIDGAEHTHIHTYIH